MAIKILAYLSISFILNGIAYFLKSDFITTFPGGDFITIVITMLAINTATSSYIISKLEELSKAHPDKFNFKETYNEIKKSIVEQVVIFAASFILLIARSSKIINPVPPVEGFNYISFSVDVILTLLLILIVNSLWDTGRSIFLLTFKTHEKETK